MVKFKHKHYVEVHGMQLHIHTREAANEAPHVHVYKTGRVGKKSLKVWLDTLKIASGENYLKPAERKIAMKNIAIFRDELLDLWVERHGVSKKR